MPGFGDMMQKAFYLGVGLASYASEQASGRFGELQERAQKLADELVSRGEMTADEARRFVEDVMQQGKEAASQAVDQATKTAAQAAAQADRGTRTPSGNTRETDPKRNSPQEPRRIEILDDDDDELATPPRSATPPTPKISAETSIRDLHDQVTALKDELNRLRRESK